MSEYLYGLEHQESLDSSVGGAVETALDYAGTDDKAALDEVTWPIRVHVYQRMSIAKHRDMLAEAALEEIMERLEEYLHPDGGISDATTENMGKAAIALADVVVAEFVPWACEPTGQVIEVTREMVERDEMPEGVR